MNFRCALTVACIATFFPSTVVCLRAPAFDLSYLLQALGLSNQPETYVPAHVGDFAAHLPDFNEPRAPASTVDSTRVARPGSHVTHADWDEFNFIVELGLPAGGKCTATCCLCGSRSDDGQCEKPKVVTAAHCFESSSGHVTALKVPVHILLRQNGTTHNLTGELHGIHPDRKAGQGRPQGPDLALVKVISPFPDNYDFNRVLLLKEAAPKVGSNLSLGGFGGAGSTELFIAPYTYEGNGTYGAMVRSRDKEVVSMGGDSGGPWFTKLKNRVKLWGVHSGASPTERDLAYFAWAAKNQWLVRHHKNPGGW